MTTKTKKWFRYSATVLLFLIILFIILKRNDLITSYIKLFKISAIISHHNKSGQLEGEYTSYIRGKIYVQSYFKNGLREGWCVWYDENTGKKKDEIYYRKGVAEGTEHGYYPNGSLDYFAQWKNGRYFNSEYHY